MEVIFDYGIRGYLEITFKVKFPKIKRKDEQLQKFVDYVEAQRTMYKGCPNDIAISLDNLVSIGLDMDTIVWLRKNHYISVQKDKPIWIAWENKYYPKNTIAVLKYFLNKNKK